MKQTEIVWIYGASGAGKETFIKKVSQEKPEKIIEQFGWEGMDIIPCGESVEWVALSDTDPKGPQREALLEAVAKLARPNSVILIKGQDLDLVTDRLRRLKNILPGAEHRIIFVDTALNELFERCEQKPWYKERPWYRKPSKRKMAGWRKFQMNHLKKLASEFEIIAIDGNSGSHYEFVRFPPY
jgi:hypothetical protein